LRVLQERTFRRLGGRQEQSVDVRVIAATNQNPIDAVRAGKLREDLFYRLNVFAIELPPLRERREDVPLLIQTFLGEFNTRNSKSVRAVDQETLQILEQYPWPGNIRELRNVIERAVLLCPGDEICLEHLPEDRSREPRDQGAPDTTRPVAARVRPHPADLSRAQEDDRQRILDALAACAGNQSRAAKMLGIPRRTFVARLDRYEIPRPKKNRLVDDWQED